MDGNYSAIVRYKLYNEYFYGLLINDVIVISITDSGMSYLPKSQLPYDIYYELVSGCKDDYNLCSRYIHYTLYGSPDIFHGIIISTDKSNNSAKCVEYIDELTGRVVINDILYKNIIF